MHHHLAPARLVPMLPQINALPGPERQATIDDGDTEANRRQRRFDVGRHIVGAFERVLVQRVILRHQAV